MRKSFVRLITVTALLILLVSSCNRPESDGLSKIEDKFNSIGSVEVEKETLDLDYEKINDKSSENSKIIYDEMKRKNEEDFNKLLELAGNTTKNSNELSLAEKLFYNYYSIYSWTRIYAPYIGIVSFACGVVVAVFSKYNKGVRRFGIIGLCIFVPLAMVILVFGIGIFHDMFLY